MVLHELRCKKNPDAARMRLITCHFPASILNKLDHFVNDGFAANRSELIRHAVMSYLEFLKTPMATRELVPINIAATAPSHDHPGYGRTECPVCHKLVSARWGCKKYKNDKHGGIGL
jgi:hypothetical protein